MKSSERAKHISYWQQSGQSKKAYCESAGIKYPTFMSWLKKQNGLVKTGGFVKIEKPKRNSRLEIVFSSGIRIYCQEELTIDLLKKLQSV